MTPTLVDTSVWVEYLRRGNALLAEGLDEGSIRCHQFVIGELACGHLQERTPLIGLWSSLPMAPTATHDEAMTFVEAHAIAGCGIGWVDVHLLASAMLGHLDLWTVDRRLGGVAETLGITSDRK